MYKYKLIKLKWMNDAINDAYILLYMYLNDNKLNIIKLKIIKWITYVIQ